MCRKRRELGLLEAKGIELTKFVTNTKGSWSSPICKESLVVRQTPTMASSNNVGHCAYWTHHKAASNCCQHEQSNMHLCHSLPFLPCIALSRFSKLLCWRRDEICLVPSTHTRKRNNFERSLFLVLGWGRLLCLCMGLLVVFYGLDKVSKCLLMANFCWSVWDEHFIYYIFLLRKGVFSATK